MKKKSPGRKGWLKKISIAAVILLLLPAVQVLAVRFLNPPGTLPMTLRWTAHHNQPGYHASVYQWRDRRRVARTCSDRDEVTSLWSGKPAAVRDPALRRTL